MRPQRFLLVALAACLLLGALAWYFGRPGAGEGGVKGGSRPSGMESVRLYMPGQEEGEGEGALAAAGDQGKKKEERPSVHPPPQDREPRERSSVAVPEPVTTPFCGIRGRVLGPGGRPVPGALVLAALLDESSPWPLDARSPRGIQPASATTRSDGGFAIAGLQPGAFRLAVRKDGFAGLDLDEPWLPADGVDVGDLWLPRGIAVEGSVLDEKGRPVAGALLVALDPILPKPPGELNERAGSPIAISAIDGTFRTHRIRPGPWRILVSHREHPEELFEGTLMEKERSTQLQLRQGALISGHVTGLPPEPRFVVRAAPIRLVLRTYDARVELADELEYCSGYRASYIDARGTFVLQGLEPGERYLLRVLREDQLLGADDAFAAWKVVPAGTEGVVLAHGPGGVLACGVRDRAAVRPLTEFTLEWDRAHPRRQLDAHGAELREHPEGRVHWEEIRPPAELPVMLLGMSQSQSAPLRLVVEADGYERMQFDRIFFAPGELLDLGWVELAPLPTLRVRVVEDESSRPVHGADVVLGAGAGSRTVHARTDARGIASIAALPDVDATVRASVAGRAAASARVPRDLRGMLELPLAQEASVVVQVLDPGSSALIAAEVLRTFRGPDPTLFEVEGELVSERQHVDSSGRAWFQGLEPGPHGFAARLFPRAGFHDSSRASATGWTEVNVRTGERASIALYTAGLGAIEGEIRDGREALGGALLELRLLDSPLSTGFEGSWTPTAFPALGRTDERGRFTFWRLATGEYSLVVRHAQSETVTRRTLRVKPGARTVRFDARDTSVRGSSSTQLADVLVHPALALDESALQPGLLFSRLTEPEPLLRTQTNDAGAFVLPVFPADVPCEIVVRGQFVTGAQSVEVREGSSSEVHVETQTNGWLELSLHAEKLPRDTALGMIAMHTSLPPVSGTRSAIVTGKNPDLVSELPPGRWKVRLCSLFESEIVMELGPWKETEIAPFQVARLRLEWPPRGGD